MTKTNKKSILLLTELNGGGESSAVLSVFGLLSKNLNNDLHIITLGKPDINIPSYFNKHSFVEQPKSKRPFSFVRNILLSIFKVSFSINKNEPDTPNLIISTNYLMLLATLFVGKCKYSKKIYYFHGIRHSPDFERGRFNYRQIVIRILEKLAFINASVVVAPSINAKSYLVKFVKPFKIKEIKVLNNPVPDVFYKNYSINSLDKFKNSLGIPKEDKIILYSGRIAKYKGLDILLAGFCDAKRQINNLRLVLAFPSSGIDNNVFQEVKNIIKDEELLNDTILLKNLNQNELSKLYRISDLTILPSKWEFAPLSIVESFACGTLAVAGNVGNVRRIMKKIDMNLMLRKITRKEISNKIKYVISLNIQKRRKIVDLGKKYAHSYKCSSNSKKVNEIFS